jgi:hypothetical protein
LPEWKAFYSWFLSFCVLLQFLFFAFVNCAKWFHCDVTINVYHVLNQIHPLCYSFLSLPLFLNNFNEFHNTTLIPEYKGHQSYSAPSPLSFSHPSGSHLQTVPALVLTSLRGF